MRRPTERRRSISKRASSSAHDSAPRPRYRGKVRRICFSMGTSLKQEHCGIIVVIVLRGLLILDLKCYRVVVFGCCIIVLLVCLCVLLCGCGAVVLCCCVCMLLCYCVVMLLGYCVVVMSCCCVAQSIIPRIITLPTYFFLS